MPTFEPSISFWPTDIPRFFDAAVCRPPIGDPNIMQFSNRFRLTLLAAAACLPLASGAVSAAPKAEPVAEISTSLGDFAVQLDAQRAQMRIGRSRRDHEIIRHRRFFPEKNHLDVGRLLLFERGDATSDEPDARRGIFRRRVFFPPRGSFFSSARPRAFSARRPFSRPLSPAFPRQRIFSPRAQASPPRTLSPSRAWRGRSFSPASDARSRRAWSFPLFSSLLP